MIRTSYRLVIATALMWSAMVGCDSSPSPEVVSDTVGGLFQGGTGVVRYAKLIRVPGQPETTEFVPARRVDIEIRTEGGEFVAALATDDNGEFEYPASSSLLQVTARARSRGPRVNVGVFESIEDDVPWTVVGELGAPERLDITEEYAAGAFNIVHLANVTGDTIAGLVSDDPAPELRVIWGDASFPACGSCFYQSAFRMELTGAPGDIDAHDDDVVLHEFGHYLEAAYGVYGNPGGYHEVSQRVSPPLAWSEGFATWFSGWVRGNAIYTDIQPGGNIYQLNLETMNGVSLGVVVPGDPASNHSEGLIYGIMWDLIDGGATDDDSISLDPLTLMSAALDPQAVADLGRPGPDFTDWLASWQCTVPEATQSLSSLTSAVSFPYDATATTDLCTP